MAQITPKYKLRVNWDGSAGFAQTGAELSARLLALDCARGRDYASNLIGKAVAGQLNGTLLNTSEDYSSFNTSSPLFGSVEPDKEIVLRAHGRAAQFVIANSEYLTGGDVLDITTGDFSLWGWLLPDALSTVQGIVNKRDRASSTNLGYAVELQTDGTLDFLISDGTAVTTISSTTVFSAGTFYLWILTADRDGNAQFYINAGAAEGAASIATQNGTLANAIAFTLGAGNSSGVDRFFGGRMVAVGHAGRLLSSAERTFLYRDGDGVRYRDIGLTGDGSALKTSLNAWYDLQETSGNRADSENSNTLTDTNTVTDAEGVANYSLWRGYTQGIDPQPNQSGRDVAQVKATGPLGLNLNKIRLASASSELTGTAWDRILTEAGWPTAERTTEAGKTTMTRFFLEDEVKVINALRRIEATENGYGGESPDGRIVFEDRRHRQLAPFNTSQATFTDANGGALVYTNIDQRDSRQQLFQIFTVPVNTDTVGSLAVLWTLSSAGANSPKISPGETLIFWAQHPNPGSATDVIGVDAWTTPVENTDYESNTQAGGGGSDSSGDLTVVVTKFFGSMKIAITSGALVDVFLTKVEARGSPVTRDNISRVTIDNTSVVNKRTFPNPPEYVPDIGEAFNWANWNSAVFSQIQPILEMRFLGNRDQAHLAQAFGRDISDRITVVGTNSAGLGINEDFYIEYIRFVMDAVLNTLWVTWGLSAAKLQDGWTLGTSKLGTETRLAYT